MSNPEPVTQHVVRPGDTVLLLIRNCTAEAAEHAKAQLRERLPGIDVAVITGVDALHVYRPA